MHTHMCTRTHGRARANTNTHAHTPTPPPAPPHPPTPRYGLFFSSLSDDCVVVNSHDLMTQQTFAALRLLFMQAS